MENLRKYAADLESMLNECPQCRHRSTDFRATRPPDLDELLGQEDDSDVMMDNDQDSDDVHDHSVMAICNIPPQSLQVR